MNLNDYQQAAMKTAAYPAKYRVTYPLLALNEEVGEMTGIFAKATRKNRDLTDEEMARAKKELGDVLWNVAALADGLGMTLEDVAQTNLDKLADRAARGVIVGEGDDR